MLPKLVKPHTSLNWNVLLGEKLVDFAELSKENIKFYVNSVCKGERRPNIPVIFSTAAEEEEAQRI